MAEQRRFVYADGSKDGLEIQDPDPAMTPEDVKDWASEFYPELKNATVLKETKDGVTTYTFKKVVGTKGANPECYQPALSPIGWCMNRNRCDRDLTDCPVVFGINSGFKAVKTKPGAKYQYKRVRA